MTSLDDYLTWSGEVCGNELQRLFSPHALQARGQLYDLILDYPTRGGKAMRPALALSSCLGFGGRVEDIAPTAATLELYHNAFLIHDDIEDGSLFRRNEPALHIEHGVPVAINVGDAMLSLALQPLLDNVSRIGLGPALRILQTVSDMTRITVEGQAIELEWVRDNTWDIGDEHYLAMVERKTSWYSFIIPMQVGAMAAGAAPSTLERLERFGRSLGAAFQITDDLLNLRAEPEDYGKEIGGDLWEGKRTLMLLHAVRTANPDDRARAIAILGRSRPDGRAQMDSDALLDRLASSGDLSPAGRAELADYLAGAAAKTRADVQWLFELVTSAGSLDYARQVANALAGDAASTLSAISELPASTHRHMLEDLVDFVVERTK